jgi:hypothetical protein
MALHIILGLVAIFLSVVFVRYMIGRTGSGLPGVDLISGLLLIIVAGLPLTAAVAGIFWLVLKITGKEVSSSIQVVSIFAAAAIQWIFWSQLLAFAIQNLL